MTKVTPVIHMIRWNMASICGAYVDACSGSVIQKGQRAGRPRKQARDQKEKRRPEGPDGARKPLCALHGCLDYRTIPGIYPLKLKSTVFGSLPVIVTFWVCVPYFSCQASMT